MNVHRYTKAQRHAWVKAKQEDRKSVKDILKEAQISRATLYVWISEFEAAQLADSSKEIAATGQADSKPAVANLPSLSNGIQLHPTLSNADALLLNALSQIDPDAAIRKRLAQTLVRRFTMSVTQACALVDISPDIYGYKPRRPEVSDSDVSEAFSALLRQDPARSYDDCSALLRQTHPGWTRKQLKRVYREQRLYLLRKRKKPLKGAVLPPGQVLYRPGASWFVGLAALADGHTLYLIDDSDRTLLESLSFEAFPAEADVAAFLSIAVSNHGQPRKARVQGTPPLNSREVMRWAMAGKVVLQTLSMAKAENVREAADFAQVLTEQ